MLNIPPPLLEALLSVLRSMLSVGAGYLVGKGWLNADLASSIVGLLMIAVPMVWGAWQKYAADRKTRELVAAAMAQPREQWTPEQRAAVAAVAQSPAA